MIVETENLVRMFKNKTVLNEINFRMDEGEIHAILGKNGAGKSTLIKIILGLLHPTSGKISVYGGKPGTNNNRVSYLSENISLYPHLSAKDNLRVAAYTSNNKLSNKEISNILECINLENVGNKAVASFSLGMKRRLQLAMTTMIKKVDFLILDEPTNGLDINGLIWIKKYMKEMQAQGTSIFLASHSILDLQECITNYDILHKGIIKRQGKWEADHQEVTGFEIIVSPESLKQTNSILENAGGEIKNSKEGSIEVGTSMAYKQICEILYKHDIFPERVTAIKNSLEQIYLDTVKEIDL